MLPILIMPDLAYELEDENSHEASDIEIELEAIRDLCWDLLPQADRRTPVSLGPWVEIHHPGTAGHAGEPRTGEPSRL